MLELPIKIAPKPPLYILLGLYVTFNEFDAAEIQVPTSRQFSQKRDNT